MGELCTALHPNYTTPPSETQTSILELSLCEVICSHRSASWSSRRRHCPCWSGRYSGCSWPPIHTHTHTHTWYANADRTATSLKGSRQKRNSTNEAKKSSHGSSFSNSDRFRRGGRCTVWLAVPLANCILMRRLLISRWEGLFHPLPGGNLRERADAAKLNPPNCERLLQFSNTLP